MIFVLPILPYATCFQTGNQTTSFDGLDEQIKATNQTTLHLQSLASGSLAHKYEPGYAEKQTNQTQRVGYTIELWDSV